MDSQKLIYFPINRFENEFPKSDLISKIWILISVSDSKMNFRKLGKFPRIGFKNQFQI